MHKNNNNALNCLRAKRHQKNRSISTHGDFSLLTGANTTVFEVAEPFWQKVTGPEHGLSAANDERFTCYLQKRISDARKARLILGREIKTPFDREVGRIVSLYSSCNDKWFAIGH